MEERIENQEFEIVDISEDTEILDDVNEECDGESASLVESIATLAVLTAPLAISYVAGVLTSDKVKNGIANAKTRLAERSKKRKEKIAELREKRKNTDEEDTEIIDIEEDD